MAESVFREPTELEKKDTIFLNPLGDDSKTIFEKFRDLLVDVQQKHTKDLTPFCFRCARLDFKDEIDKQMNEFGRGEGYLTNDKELKISLPSRESLDKTYGETRFKLIKESDAMEPIAQTSTSMARQTKIGVHRDFQCKIRNCGVSVFIPTDKLKEAK